MVAEAHSTGTVVQRSDQHVALDGDFGLRQLLRKSPELAAAGDGSLVVQIHRMNVDTLLSLEPDRDHLACLGVITKAG
jgi:hypothetical protein